MGAASNDTFRSGQQGTLVAERVGGSYYFYLYDGLGNTIALMNSSGGVANTYAYDPYGKMTGSSGTVANPFRFGGAYGAYSDTTNLIKIRARYYDSGLGRWSQLDPIEGCKDDPVILNRYAYVGGNPINNIDPSRLFFHNRGCWNCVLDCINNDPVMGDEWVWVVCAASVIGYAATKNGLSCGVMIACFVGAGISTYYCTQVKCD